MDTQSPGPQNFSWFKGREEFLREMEFIKNNYKDRQKTEKLLSELQRVAPVTVTLPPLENKGYVYRSRLHDENFQGLPTRLAQLGARNRDDINHFGRANVLKQSIFYGSPTMETALNETVRWHIDGYDPLMFIDWAAYVQRCRHEGMSEEQIGRLEAKKNRGEFFWRKATVSKWRIEEPLFLIPVIESELMAAPELVNLLKTRHAKPSYMPDVAWEYLDALFSFFGKEFARRDFLIEDDYLLTALFANQLYDFSRNIRQSNGRPFSDGIMYLSIASGYVGINYAITENALHKIKIMEAYDVLIINSERDDDAPPDRLSELRVERISTEIKDGIIS